MTKEKKLYVFIGFNDPKIHKRGVENIILLQSKALEGNKIFYIFFGPTTKISKWGNIIVVSVKKFHFFKMNLILGYLKNRYKAQLFIHSHNYQLSCFCLYKTDVFTVHDGLSYLYECFKRKYLFVFKAIEKSVYRRSAKIHFISEFSRSKALLLEKYYNKSVIIYNSTPLEILNESILDKQPQIGKEQTVLKIFSVRTIEDRAGIDLLIDACLKLNESLQNVVIKIAGKGPQLEYYQQKIKEKNITNIVFLGYINDVDLLMYYRDCDLVILPSKYGEGFGLPIIEAYLLGKPVIASNKCAIPEVINDRIMLFENDAVSVYYKIIYFIQNVDSLANPLIYSQYYAEKFSQHRIVTAYKESLYLN